MLQFRSMSSHLEIKLEKNLINKFVFAVHVWHFQLLEQHSIWKGVQHTFEPKRVIIMKVSANTQWKLKHVKMSKGFTFSEVDISLLSLLHTVKTTHSLLQTLILTQVKDKQEDIWKYLLLLPIFLNDSHYFQRTFLGTVGYSIKTKFCLDKLAASGCLGWPEFSSSIFNALFNQIQEVQ